MLKIVSEDLDGSATGLKLEGRVIGPWVEELRRICDEILAKNSRLTIDLSDVSFIDLEGVRLCRGLKERQVVLRNSSGFVAEQLKSSAR
jgi:anti-anti-sigma regulatory factor